jgi:hypothetical protein
MEFICERCERPFTCKRNIIDHLQKTKQCTPKSIYSPSTCELVTKWTTKTINEVNFPCKHCGKRFNSKSAMYKHSRSCAINRDQTSSSSHIGETNDNEQNLALQSTQNKCTQTENFESQELQQLREENHKLHQNNERIRMQLQLLQVKKNEDFYQDILEKYFKATHKRLAIGITDITTEDTHIEIKRWSCWREAFAQLILYNSHDPKEKLYACFFGEFAQPAKTLAIASLKQQNIICFELQNTQDVIHMVNLEDNTKQVVWGVAIEEASS